MPKTLRFIPLQLFVSAVPAILLNATIPLLGAHMGLSTEIVGMLFAALRAGAIVGTLFISQLTDRYTSRMMAVACEISNLILMASILAVMFLKLPSLILLPLLALRGVTSSSLLVSRFSLIRKIDGGPLGTQTALLVNVVSQSAYGISGILFMTNLITKENAFLIVAIDGLTSIIGAVLFFLSSSEADLQKKIRFHVPLATVTLKNLRQHPWLTLSEAFIAVALGGTNILLVKYGASNFANFGGYGTSLLIYAIFYGLGGLWIMKQHQRLLRFRRTFDLPWVVMFAMVAILGALGNQGIVGVSLCYAGLFIAYAVAKAIMEAIWFQTSTPETAAAISSQKFFMIGIIGAISEFIFSFNNPNDFYLRMIFIFLSGAVIAVYSFNRVKTEAKIASK